MTGELETPAAAQPRHDSGLRRGLPAIRVARASVPAKIAFALWVLGALVVWNTVFDAHIVKGARDYVDRQQLFIEGRGPRQDMERSMAAARTAGLRAAWLWTGVELVPGAAVLMILRRRRLVR